VKKTVAWLGVTVIVTGVGHTLPEASETTWVTVCGAGQVAGAVIVDTEMTVTGAVVVLTETTVTGDVVALTGPVVADVK
jgi:nitrous oxidase accessory protein NosD